MPKVNGDRFGMLRRTARKSQLLRIVWAKAWALVHYWPQMRARPGPTLNFLFMDPELENYTYPIANLGELAEFLSSVLGLVLAQATSYIEELEQDSDFRSEL